MFWVDKRLTSSAPSRISVISLYSVLFQLNLESLQFILIHACDVRTPRFSSNSMLMSVMDTWRLLESFHDDGRELTSYPSSKSFLNLSRSVSFHNLFASFEMIKVLFLWKNIIKISCEEHSYIIKISFMFIYIAHEKMSSSNEWTVIRFKLLYSTNINS